MFDCSLQYIVCNWFFTDYALRKYLMPIIIYYFYFLHSTFHHASRGVRICEDDYNWSMFYLIKRARVGFCCFDLLSMLSESTERLTCECIFSFPWMTKLFCPGTDLVSGMQGSRWGPGFLQAWTKLTVIPGALLLERN